MSADGAGQENPNQDCGDQWDSFQIGLRDQCVAGDAERRSLVHDRTCQHNHQPRNRESSSWCTLTRAHHRPGSAWWLLPLGDEFSKLSGGSAEQKVLTILADGLLQVGLLKQIKTHQQVLTERRVELLLAEAWAEVVSKARDVDVVKSQCTHAKSKIKFLYSLQAGSVSDIRPVWASVGLHLAKLNLRHKHTTTFFSLSFSSTTWSLAERGGDFFSSDLHTHTHKIRNFSLLLQSSQHWEIFVYLATPLSSTTSATWFSAF